MLLLKRLKCSQYLHEITDDTLNANINTIINAMGGFRTIISKLLATKEINVLQTVLRDIKTKQDKNDIQNNDNNINRNNEMKLIGLPKDILYKTFSFLEMNQVKRLKNTCINMSIHCLPYLKYVDIKVMTYNDLLFNDAIIVNSYDMNDKIYKRVRFDGTLNVTGMIKQATKNNRAAFFVRVGEIYSNNIDEVYKLTDSNEKKILNSGHAPKYYVFFKKNKINILPNGPNEKLLTWDNCKFVKYFDIVAQKLYVIDIIGINENTQLDELMGYITGTLIKKHPNIYKIYNQYKDYVEESKLFAFYTQTGMAYEYDIPRLRRNVNITRKVIIFQFNTTSLQRSDKNKWKKNLSYQYRPFCENVVAYGKLFYNTHS